MLKIHHYLKKMGHWLLPYTCILCHNYSTRLQDLCENCFNDLPSLQHACPRCANPLSSPHNIVCGYCLKQTTSFDATYALYFYQAPISKLIMNLKFGQSLVNARILGELLAQRIQQAWYYNKPLPEVIIPVPLHPKRLKERGFNQALEIARPIAKILHLPLEFTSCQRIKHTVAQATLPANQRLQNVKNAFHIEKLPFKHVAVVDDVITTGYTINEFCQALKSTGVHSIDVWCCARPNF
jgi:ComF family protein